MPLTASVTFDNASSTGWLCVNIEHKLEIVSKLIIIKAFMFITMCFSYPNQVAKLIPEVALGSRK